MISAGAGLNEPPVAAAVNSSDLATQARALEEANGGLSPHRFSQAWDGAREVTERRITGLASNTVDGLPALQVYTESDGSTQVTVVPGVWSRHASGRPVGDPAPLKHSGMAGSRSRLERTGRFARGQE